MSERAIDCHRQTVEQLARDTRANKPSASWSDAFSSRLAMPFDRWRELMDAVSALGEVECERVYRSTR